MGFLNAMAHSALGLGSMALDMASKPEVIILEVDHPTASIHGQTFSFQYNPESLKLTRAQAVTSAATIGGEGKKEDQAAAAQKESQLSFDVIFDTYEERKSVYTEYISKLDAFVAFDPNSHVPCNLVLHYGAFTKSLRADMALRCKLDSLAVDYTMFLKDGTPVRAKATLTLRVGLTAHELQERKQKNSPDHAKLVTIKRGETLSDLAASEYDNPAEWRRIARANGIDDPMNVLPGTKLMVPPILSGRR